MTGYFQDIKETVKNISKLKNILNQSFILKNVSCFAANPGTVYFLKDFVVCKLMENEND